MTSRVLPVFVPAERSALGGSSSSRASTLTENSGERGGYDRKKRQKDCLGKKEKANISQPIALRSCNRLGSILCCHLSILAGHSLLSFPFPWSWVIFLRIFSIVSVAQWCTVSLRLYPALVLSVGLKKWTAFSILFNFLFWSEGIPDAAE